MKYKKCHIDLNIQYIRKNMLLQYVTKPNNFRLNHKNDENLVESPTTPGLTYGVASFNLKAFSRYLSQVIII